MQASTHFGTFAQYNKWANERLSKAVGGLSSHAFTADCGAFFGSVCGTLNHILVTDTLWLARLTGATPPTLRLDERLHEDAKRLCAAQSASDARLIAFIDGLAEADFERQISYTTISLPQQIVQPMAEALGHLFNHQTHHRGQAHALLTALGGRDFAPSLDLLLFQREHSRDI